MKLNPERPMKNRTSRNFAAAAALLSACLLIPVPPSLAQAAVPAPSPPRQAGGQSFQERLRTVIGQSQGGPAGSGGGLAVPQMPGAAALPPGPPAWPDSGLILTNIAFENLPLSEVVRYLRQGFKQEFDVILPQSYRPVPGGSEVSDVNAIGITLTLKNAGSEDVFNAMNSYFEINGIPLRWELSMTGGDRRLAILRPSAPWPPPVRNEPQHMIFYVGDLLGNGKSGGMTIDQIAKTVTDVHTMSFPNSNSDTVIGCYRDADLIVVTGSGPELQFIGDTIRALRDKAHWDAGRIPPTSAAPPRNP